MYHTSTREPFEMPLGMRMMSFLVLQPHDTLFQMFLSNSRLVLGGGWRGDLVILQRGLICYSIWTTSFSLFYSPQISQTTWLQGGIEGAELGRNWVCRKFLFVDILHQISLLNQYIEDWHFFLKKYLHEKSCIFFRYIISVNTHYVFIFMFDRQKHV